jgi:hypothetical protein
MYVVCLSVNYFSGTFNSVKWGKDFTLGVINVFSDVTYLILTKQRL